MTGWPLFLHRLALKLGRTVNELLATTDSVELSQWTAFYQVEPWGDRREDYRFGVLAALMVNAWMKAAGDEPAKPQDFFPELIVEQEDEDPAERMKATLNRMVALAPGKN